MSIIMIHCKCLSFGILFTILILSTGSIETATAQIDIPLEDVGNDSENGTATEAEPSNEVEQFTLKAQLKPDENEFLAEDGYYEIRKFGYATSNGSEICPTNSCKYGVENGQFSPNSFTGGYTFEGKLKVTTEDGDTKKSKFYDFSVSLDKTGEEETGGETTQTLEGTFGLGGDTFSPDIEYDITNSTLLVDEKSPILTIQGERTPF